MRTLFITTSIFFAVLTTAPAAALAHTGDVAETGEHENQEEAALVHFFGRDDCKFCAAEKVFLNDLAETRNDIHFIYYNIGIDSEARTLFEQVAEANELARVTPITLVGGRVIQGFNSADTTGATIITAAERALAQGAAYPLSYYLSKQEVVRGGEGCAESESGACEIIPDETGVYIFNLPLIGTIDLQDFSLFSLASVLGFIDGFNPCAMWVLITFLLILLQIGDRKKMWQVAGLFILAEAVMYFFILNVWYKTWDFVGLDAIVTPLVGLLAVGGGVYFLRKYFKNRGTLTCDVTDFEYQKGIEGKIKALVHSPLTLATIAGVIGIAFSVNVIEFACSIGIPQAFTKILELNDLSFLAHQFYILVYTLLYMVDDLIVFGLALYGFNYLHGSYKYAQYSALIGGILMLVLGLLLLFAPDVLVF